MKDVSFSCCVRGADCVSGGEHALGSVDYAQFFWKSSKALYCGRMIMNDQMLYHRVVPKLAVALMAVTCFTWRARVSSNRSFLSFVN